MYQHHVLHIAETKLILRKTLKLIRMDKHNKSGKGTYSALKAFRRVQSYKQFLMEIFLE